MAIKLPATKQHAGPNQRRYFLLIGTILLLGGIVFLLPNAGVESLQPAPDFVINAYDGTTYTMPELRNQVVVINFWATWCEPCLEEAPVLAQAWQQYRNQGVQFLGVVVEDSQELAQRFVQQHKLTYPHGDATGVSQQFGVSNLPATFILDADGMIYRRIDGTISQSRLIAEIEAALSH